MAKIVRLRLKSDEARDVVYGLVVGPVRKTVKPSGTFDVWDWAAPSYTCQEDLFELANEPVDTLSENLQDHLVEMAYPNEPVDTISKALVKFVEE